MSESGSYYSSSNSVKDNYQSKSARVAPTAAFRDKVTGVKGDDGSEDIILRQITILKHKNMQLKFMGEENADLTDQIKHLRDVISALKQALTSETEAVFSNLD